MYVTLSNALLRQGLVRKPWKAVRGGMQVYSGPGPAVSRGERRSWSILLALALGILPLLTGCQEESPQFQQAPTASLAASGDGELQVLRAQVKTLQNELAQLRAAMRSGDEALTLQVRAVSAAANSTTAALDAVSAAVVALSTTTADRFDALDQQLQYVDASLVATATTLAGLRSDVDDQQTALWTVQSDLAAVEAVANSAAALAATWPAAVSRWAEGRYVQRFGVWGRAMTCQTERMRQTFFGNNAIHLTRLDWT